MDYRLLGTTDLRVSSICLGTMTWGEQNTEADAHAQLDLALELGVNFIDTAELYPVPPRAETQGLTERWIGNWLRGRKDRGQLVIASKIAGPGPRYFRGGTTRYTPAELREALEGSLDRLQTDYLDLYQLHWPARNTPRFGKLGYEPGDNDDAQLDCMRDTLAGLEALRKSGLIRHYGLSNETPWGTMQWLRLADELGVARPQSIQNPYSLVNRVYEIGMAEISHREQCPLLAYSPLAFGLLSGKYQHGRRPEGARLTLYDRYARFLNTRAQEATEQYLAIARKHALDPVEMAIAFVRSRPYATAAIIGATTLDQLRTNIAGGDLSLSAAVLEEIDAVHDVLPNPGV